MMEEIKGVFERLDKVAAEVNVDAVFGAPREFEGCVLIPVAELTYGLVAGAGTPPTPSTERTPEITDEEHESTPCCAENTESSIGAGGASGAHARPIAFIEVRPEGASIRPIENETLIAVMGILLAGWTVGWAGLVLKTIFGRRR